MSQENANLIVALARVTHSANGGAVTPTYGLAKGFTNNATFGAGAGQGGTHSALGVYVLVLDTPVDPNTCLAIVTASSTTIDQICNAQITNSGQTVTVTTSTGAGAASDAIDFACMVVQPPNG